MRLRIQSYKPVRAELVEAARRHFDRLSANGAKRRPMPIALNASWYERRRVQSHESVRAELVEAARRHFDRLSANGSERRPIPIALNAKSYQM